MSTLQVHVRAENAGVGVRQQAAETMGIWQDQGGLTTQQIDNKVRECVCECEADWKYGYHYAKDYDVTCLFCS